MTDFTIGKPSRDRWLNMLIYGPYGAGKTYLAGTAREVATMQDVLFIDAESGQMTLADFAKDIDTIEISSYAQLARVLEFLRLHCRLRDEKNTEKLKALEAKFRGCKPTAIKKPRQYKTVVLDSLTEIQKYCLYQIMHVDLDTVTVDAEPGDPGWAGYGKLAEMTRVLIRSFRNLPMHTIFVCGANETVDERQRKTFSPLLTGKKTPIEVQGLVDVVGFIYAAAASKDTDGNSIPARRRLYLQPSQTFNAKDRYHSGDDLPYLDAPSLKGFLKGD